MTPLGRPTLEEVLAAAERRADDGRKVHPGFDFASMAPSPLKRRAAESSAVADEFRIADEAGITHEAGITDTRAIAPEPSPATTDEITARLGAARERLRRATEKLDRAT
ncbi:MAG: hypothetical protein WAO61_07315 [Solirubrobacterales bacterium]